MLKVETNQYRPHCKPRAALNDRKVTILDRHLYLLGVVYFWGYVQLAAAACWQAT